MRHKLLSFGDVEGMIFKQKIANLTVEIESESETRTSGVLLSGFITGSVNYSLFDLRIDPQYSGIYRRNDLWANQIYFFF